MTITDPDRKQACQYCHEMFVVGAGLTNHERGCLLNPGRRSQKRRARKLCPKCRTLVDAGNFDRHYPICAGRLEDSGRGGIIDVPGVLTRSGETSTAELLAELLFPDGMPANPEFIRAFRAWLDATDALVALAGMDR